MKITYNNLGPIKKAEIEIGDLTIICGSNNTGKTYATHVVYGLLEFLHKDLVCGLSKQELSDLMNNGNLSLALDEYWKRIRGQGQYSRSLGKVFAGNGGHFNESRIRINLDTSKLSGSATAKFGFRHSNGNEILIKVSGQNNLLEMALSTQDDTELQGGHYPPEYLNMRISHGLRTALFTKSIPRPFLSSTERTGAAIFQRELDFTRNRLVDLLGDKSANLSPARLLGRFSGEYPIAVRNNVDFIRSLPDIAGRESQIMQDHPDLLDAFADIVGGNYLVSRDGNVRFAPKSNKRTRLTLVESSSGVRSLLDIGFYLRHVAASGDILIVDEPELNLHPDNQRKLARLFAALVNLGIKVFITTHSYYIVKEFNTLIMLNQNDARIKNLVKAYRYDQGALLDHNKVRAYIAKEGLVQLERGKRKTRSIILEPMARDGLNGMRASSFDSAIEEINAIQADVLFGGDD